MVAISSSMIALEPVEDLSHFDDCALLSRYVDAADQRAFEQIVARHSRWIFSLAVRSVRDRHLAEDVTQAVFVILAKKAAVIAEGTPICGWLFKTARFAVSDALKRRMRLQRRETRAAELKRHKQSRALIERAGDIDEDVSEALDDAVSCLSESDRQAVLLRFYEEMSLAEVGQRLGISEEAAKKRVARALIKLRKTLARRGVIAPAALILLLFAGRGAEAAILPASLAGGCGAASGSAAAQSLAQGAIELMATAHRKLLGSILAIAMALIVCVPTLGGVVVSAVREIIAPERSPSRIVPYPGALDHDADGRRIQMPADAKFADLWIGYKGQILWRSDTYGTGLTGTAPAPSPFLLKQAESRERPYAVGVDRNGVYFIKPLDQAILQSSPIRQALVDYDQGPFDPASRVHSMLSLIDPEAASSASALPNPGSGKLADGKPADWHKLRRDDEATGPDSAPIVIEQMPGSKMFAPLNGDADGELNMFLNNFAAVPEPTSIALLIPAAALLLRRRHRR